MEIFFNRATFARFFFVLKIKNNRDEIIEIRNNCFFKKALAIEFNKKWYSAFCEIDMKPIEADIKVYFDSEMMEIEKLIANQKGELAKIKLEKFIALAMSDSKLSNYSNRIKNAQATILCQAYFWYILGDYKNSEEILTTLKNENFNINGCFNGRNDWYNKSISNFSDFNTFCNEVPDITGYIRKVIQHFKVNKLDNTAHILFYFIDSTIQINRVKQIVQKNTVIHSDTLKSTISNKKYLIKVNAGLGEDFSYFASFIQNMNNNATEASWIKSNYGFDLVISDTPVNPQNKKIILAFKKVATGRYVITSQTFIDSQ